MSTIHPGRTDGQRPPHDEQGIALLPGAVDRFFATDHGRVLLVKGPPGSGKTLFTAQCLDALQRDGDVMYVSSRVDRETVYETVFADHTALDRTQIVDISQTPFDLPVEIEVPFEKLELDSLFEWLQQIRQATRRLTVAFDSWTLIYSYLASHQRNPISIERATNRLAALARAEDLRLVLVVETAEATPLEYIADGVVRMETEEARGHARRYINFEKLRGVRIGTRRHPVTLAEGVFRAITGVDLTAIQAVGDGTWSMIDNTKATFSTGIRDLDRILSGGYNRGSLVHLELAADLPRDAWGALALPTVRNFLANGLQVAVAPPREGSPGLLHKDLNTVLDEETACGDCYVVETYANADGSEQLVGEEATATAAAVNASTDRSGEPPHVSVRQVFPSTRESADQITQEAIADDESNPALLQASGAFAYGPYVAAMDRLRTDDHGAMLHVISLDAVQADSEPQLQDFANYVALHNDLSILLTKPDTGRRQRVDQVADVHFRVERLDDAIVAYGENPPTPLLGVGIDRSEAIPTLTLTEVV